MVYPIGSYVKAMLDVVGHLGRRLESLDIILKEDHLKTIPSSLVPIGQAVSEEKIFETFFP